MRNLLTATLAFALATIISACAAPPRTTMLDSNASTASSYDDQFSDDSDNTIFITFSGGGMRAAALSYGVLKALKAQTLANGNRLIYEVDLVSSVSGGSVTAAYWALKGSDDFDWKPKTSSGSKDPKEHFVERFLQRDIQTPMIAKGLITLPWTLLVDLGYNRINLLIEHLDNKDLFGDATYGTLFPPGPAQNIGEPTDGIKRPYLMINATDMATGYVFSFTQDQFDLICADLAKMRLADAVAASAAYPIFLSALSLKNYSPCEAQEAMPKWERDSKERLRPNWVTKYLNSNDYPYDTYPREVLRARRAVEFLNEDRETKSIHLLDGGIVDNLGLSLPLTLLAEMMENNGDPYPILIPHTLSIYQPIGVGGDDDDQHSSQRASRLCAIIVVNARSQPDRDYGKSSMPPGIASTLFSTFGAAVDSTSLLLTDKAMSFPGPDKCIGVDKKPGVSVIRVDFDSIDNAKCRNDFHNISTSWSLSEKEIDALIRVGGALLHQSESYGNLVKVLNGKVSSAGGQAITDACKSLDDTS